MPDSALETVDTEGAKGSAPPRAMSVRGHLAVFTAVLAIPILLFVGFLLFRIATTERNMLEEQASETARAVAVALDRDMAGLLASLDVVALSANLQSGELEAFYRQVKQLSDSQGIMTILYAPSGQQLVNVRVPWGTTLPNAGLPLPSLQLDSDQPFVTDFYRGLVSGQPVFSIGKVVRSAGAPTYVLTFSLNTERLQRIIAQTEVPPSYTVSVVDRQGTIMARSLRPEEFVGRMASQDLRERATGRQGTWSGTTVDGAAIFGAYTRSNLTGFRAVAGVPHAELNEPLWRSLSLFVAIGASILALSVVLGIYFGGRITVPIQSLAKRATALGRGDAVEPLATGLAEANGVAAELVHASASLKEREAELRDANEEIQRFAYIVSHDLRSPLVNIMGFTSELEALRGDVFRRLEELRGVADDAAAVRADTQLGDDFDEAIGFIKTSIGKMDRLINAILKLSREGRREFRPERVDMTALMETIKASSAIQADAAAATIAVSRLPSIASDRLALEQIFSNLVDNALKYLRAGVPGRIEIAARVAGPNIVYEVRDNGRGVDEKDRERIFELFRRAGTQDKPGEGIGLAHVRALVRRLGGTIGLTSEPGKGSTFSVVLPKRWSAETQREAA